MYQGMAVLAVEGPEDGLDGLLHCCIVRLCLIKHVLGVVDHVGLCCGSHCGERAPSLVGDFS